MVRLGLSRRKIGSKNDAVFWLENVSVDIVKITPAHRIAGHHAHNHASQRGVGVLARSSDRLGVGRGLRQGCESTIRIQLFPSSLIEIFSFEFRPAISFFNPDAYSMR